MATVTNLAFRILSSYDGSGVRRARRDLRSFQNETAIMSSNAERISRLLLMVGPAAAPMFAVMAKAASQMATSMAAAGAATGIFALAVKAQTKDVFHAVKRLNTLREAIKELKPGSDAYIKNLDKQRRLMASLDPMERKMVLNILRLQKQFEKFGRTARPQIFRVLNTGIKILIILMKRLEPLIKPITKAIQGMANELKRFVAGKEFGKFLKWLRVEGPSSLKAWWTWLKNIGMGFIILGKRLGFLEVSGFNEWLIESSLAFRKWAESSKSVDKLRAFIEQASPVVKDFLKALIHVSGSLLTALAPAGVAMLRILTPLLEGIADLADKFPSLIQGLWAAYAASRAFNLVLFLMRAVMIGVAAQLLGLSKTFGVFILIGKGARIAAIAFNVMLAVAAMKAGVALSKLAGVLFGLQARFPRLAVMIGRLAYSIGTMAGALIRVSPHLRMTAMLARLLLNPLTALIVAGVAFQAAFYKLGQAARGTNKEWTNLIGGFVGAAGVVTLVLIYWDKFMAALRTVGDGFTWLHKSVIVPGWNGILATFRKAWEVVKAVWQGIVIAAQAAWTMMQPVFQTLKFFVMEVLPRAFTYYYNQVKMVIILVAAVIKVGWLIVKGIFQAIKWFIVNVVAPAFQWLHRSVIRPVWNAIVAVIRWAWGIVRTVFAATIAFLRNLLGPAFHWFNRSVIRPVWSGIGSFIRGAWNNVIKPVWDKLVHFITRTIPNAFRKGVDAARGAWNKLKSAAKDPINFVIGLYNSGLVALMNKIADFAFGKGKGPRLGTISKFARGGIMPGYSPGRDSLMAMVSPGESIFRPEFTKAVGSRFVDTANRIARTGGPQAVSNWLSEGGFRDTKGFARGGVVGGFAGGFDLGGIVGGVINGLKNFTILDPVKAVMGAAKKILGANFPGGGMFRDLVAKLPDKMLSMLTGWIKKNAGFGGGPGMRRALAWAKTQDNKPYQWAGNGNPSWDCSGFMSAIESVIRGQRPHRRWSTHAFNGGVPPGWQRNRRSGFMIGVRHGGPGGGHTAGTLLGHAVEAGGHGVQVGPPGRNHKGFPHQFGFKADSGVLRLRPGWNPPVFNGLGTTETLEMRDNSRGKATIGEAHFHFHGPVGSKLEMQNWVRAAVRDLENQGRMPRR